MKIKTNYWRSKIEINSDWIKIEGSIIGVQNVNIKIKRWKISIGKKDKWDEIIN